MVPQNDQSLIETPSEVHYLKDGFGVFGMMKKGSLGPTVNFVNVVIAGMVWLGMGAPAFGSSKSECRRVFEVAAAARRHGVHVYPKPNQPVSSLRDLRKLRLMSYNVANFKHTVGRYVYSPKGELKLVNNLIPKGASHTNGLAETILQEDPDILFIQESEGISESEWFFSEKLNSRWTIVSWADTYDRGLLTLVAIRTTLLPVMEIASRSLAERLWIDPAGPEPVEQKLFTRDVQHTVLVEKGSEVPFLHLLNIHLKSKKTRMGDPGSAMLRSAQLDGLVDIVRDIRHEYGMDAPIALAGDFNDDFLSASELQNFLRRTRMVDSLDVRSIPHLPKLRATHAMDARGVKMIFEQLDAWLFPKWMSGTIRSSWVTVYKDAHGNPLPQPESGCELGCMPSDHRPVLVELDVQKLLGPISR